jgi:predicted RNase H-like nuclease (RuvC/YqgF family)
MIQVLGRKLQTLLSGKVKEEQIQVRAYLAELADKQAKEVALGLTQIRADMGKKPTTLPSYIDFVQRLEECVDQKENLEQKKRGLEEIKTVLTKFRPKDEGYQSLPLQGRIDQLTSDIEETHNELRKAQDDTLKEREVHVEDLEKRLFEEQEKVKQLIEDLATNEKLMRAETPGKEALDTATKIRKKYDESVRKLNQYLGY